MFLTCNSSEGILELGGWDESKIEADGELFRRITAIHKASPAILFPETPLGFYRASDISLTSHSSYGADSRRYGARREYVEAAAYWHSLEAFKPKPDLVMRQGDRPFPIPNICKPESMRQLRYDVLFVSDFSLSGPAAISGVNIVRATKDLGLSCACFHWPTLDTAGDNIDPSMRKLLHHRVAESVVAGEHVRCKLVVVLHWPILSYLPDRRPNVKTDALAIIFDETSVSHLEKEIGVSEIDRICAGAHIVYDVRPTLAPASSAARDLLVALAPEKTKIAELNWPTFLGNRGLLAEWLSQLGCSEPSPATD